MAAWAVAGILASAREPGRIACHAVRARLARSPPPTCARRRRGNRWRNWRMASFSGSRRLGPATPIRSERISPRACARTAGAPVARSVFHAYLADGALRLVKDPCRWHDAELKFFLRVAPRRLRDRPSPRQPFGCAHRDCRFRRYGLRVNGRRLATVSLPTDAKDIRAGQVFKLPRVAPRQVWHSALPVPDLSPAAVQALRAEWAAATAGAPSSTCM